MNKHRLSYVFVAVFMVALGLFGVGRPHAQSPATLHWNHYVVNAGEGMNNSSNLATALNALTAQGQNVFNVLVHVEPVTQTVQYDIITYTGGSVQPFVNPTPTPTTTPVCGGTPPWPGATPYLGPGGCGWR